MEIRTRERLIIAIFLIALAAASITWTALQLASLLADGRPAHAGLGQALSVATRMVLHPTSPIPPDRAGLPSTAAFYVALTCLVAFGAAATGAALRRTGSTAAEAAGMLREAAERVGDRLDRGAAERGARWAKRRELEPLMIERPTAGRLTLGTAHRRLIATRQLHSLLVVGPSDSRKTTGLAIPALHEWDGPVVATSVKTDLLDATIDAREALGPALIYDPAGITGRPAHRWNPLHGCRDWHTAQHRASILCRLAGGKQRHGDDFWYVRGATLLAGTFFAAAHGGHSMADVVRWIYTQEDAEVRAAIDRAGDATARSTWVSQGPERDPRLRDSTFATAQTALAAFTDSKILETTIAAEITAERLLNGPPRTLYLIAPVDRQEDLAPLFVLLLDEIATALYATGSRMPLNPPLLLVLDELANIAPILNLDKLASTIRGHGAQLLSIVQDLAQLRARYGAETANTIVNNHHAKLILPGASDPLTLDWAARVTGDEEIQQLSKTARTGVQDSTTSSTSFRPLAPAHAVRQQSIGTGFLVYGNLPPTTIDLRGGPLGQSGASDTRGRC